MANTSHTSDKGNPGARMREPPKIKFKVLEEEDLPERARDWEEIKTEFLPVDFLLLTAKDCEFRGCLSYLYEIKKGYTKTLGYVYFGFNSKEEPKFKIAVIKCVMGSSGPGGSIVVVQDAVPVLRPRAVFCVGYCGSLNEKKAKLGDVIVSSKLTTYALAKEWEDGIEERGLVVPPYKDMANLIKHAGEGWKAPLINAKDLKVTVRRDGVFLSGPLVLNNPELLDKLKKRFRQGTAIEMEGEGLYTAAHNREIEWLVIKGVSDFADGSKSGTDSWRPFASVMAASVVFHMLNDTVVFEDWPHYEGMSGDNSDSGGSSSSRKRPWWSGPGPDPKRNKPPEGESSSEDKQPRPTLEEPRSSRSGDMALSPSGGESPLDDTQSRSSTPRELPSRGRSNRAPITLTALVRTGSPSEDELDELSRQLGENWEKLGRRLGFNDAAITGFDNDYRRLQKKALKMLMAWKLKDGPNDTYKVLYDALCHPLVECRLLAEQFCCYL